ncbi:MAG: radical SAM protein [Betaproteobacteria bacterium]|nr:radical SAM protein [Betaproteobacteria bacterium]
MARTGLAAGRLAVDDHRRDSAGLLYVYPVVSRRAGGVSIGINLNTSNACNWRCVYCQVPELKRGAAPRVDLGRLERELRQFLDEVVHGSFLENHVPREVRRVNDIALSGNGEPTTASAFDQVVALIGRVRGEFKALESVKLVLITNGSLMDRAVVQQGLRLMAGLNGEVWFKLDSATPQGILRINHTRVTLDRVRDNLRITASLCPTWIQTCVFRMDGADPGADERRAYLEFLAGVLEAGTPVRGVLLYGLARPSMQPEAPRLAPVSRAWMNGFAEDIRALGLEVRVSP